MALLYCNKRHAAAYWKTVSSNLDRFVEHNAHRDRLWPKLHRQFRPPASENVSRSPARFSDPRPCQPRSTGEMN